MAYSERMLETRTVDALSQSDAEKALAEPARVEGVRIEPDALNAAFQFNGWLPVLPSGLW